MILLWSLGFVLLFAVLGGLVLRDALSVSRTLLAVSDDMLEARSAVRVGELEQADELLTDVRARLRRSSGLTTRPLWKAFARVPLLGRSLTTARLLSETADEAARVGRSLLAQSDVVLDDNGDLLIGLDGRRLSIEQMLAAADAIAAVDHDAFANRLNRLEASSASWIPAQIRDARQEAIELGREVLSTIRHAEQTLRVVPPFAGSDGPRRYFLAMQNPAELRGTGGLIGFFSVLTAVDGEFFLSEPETYDVISRPGVLESGARAPLADDEFDGRYGAADARGFVANVNLDGDLETVGPVLSELAERQLGLDFDGVVLMDPIGLARSLRNVGPVDVSDEFADATGRIPDPLPPHMIPDVALIRAYEVFGGNTEQRDDYLRELATAAFNLLFDGGWDPIAVSQDVASAALTRHLQVWSEREAEQALFASLNVNGALNTRHEGDHIAVTGVNAAANKLDVYTTRDVDVDISFLGDGSTATRLAAVSVAAANTAPAAELDSYVAGSGAYDPDRRFALRDGPHGLNRTWFTIWGPPTSTLHRLESLVDQELETPVVAELSRALAVDRSTNLLPGETDGFRAILSAPAGLRAQGPDLAYEFVLRRQPTALADAVSITVQAPTGWSILAAEAAQTAEPIVPGAEGLERTDAGATVTFSGTVDADVHVRVRFTRSLGDRLADWFTWPFSLP